MKPQKVRGLVIATYDAGESDKRLVILCKGEGRRFVYARGVRKPTSKWMHAAQHFTYADFVLNKGQGFYTLSQAQVIENFYPLREDYDRLMAAYLVTQACDKTLWDNIESDALLQLALYSLHMLSKGATPPKQVVAVFLLRFFHVFGLRPNIEHCVVCGTPAHQIATTALCPEGIVCSPHKPIDSCLVAPGVLAAMGHILNGPLKGAFLFNASEEVLKSLEKVCQLLWQCNFDWVLTGLGE